LAVSPEQSQSKVGLRREVVVNAGCLHPRAIGQVTETEGVVPSRLNEFQRDVEKFRPRVWLIHDCP
jgi:hypothetical protein